MFKMYLQHKIGYFIILFLFYSLANANQIKRVTEIQAIPSNAGLTKQLEIGFSLESGLPLTNYLNVIMPDDLGLEISKVEWTDNLMEFQLSSTNLIQFEDSNYI